MRWRAIAVTIVVIVACLIALNLASDVLVDWLWFSAVGYRDVFWTIFGAKAVLFIAVFLASAVCLWVSGTLAFRLARRRGPWLPAVPGQGSAPVPTLHDTLHELFGVAAPRLSWRLLIAAAAVAFGLLIAAGEASNWDLVLRFLHQAPYGQSDPLYGKDIGFYLFSLPAYVALKNWMLVTLVVSALVAGAVYWAHGDITLDPGQRLVDVTVSRRPRLRPVGPLFRGEGLVLWPRPLPAALRRQRSGRGGGLHRHPCRAAGPLGAGRARLHRRPRLVRQCADAHLQASAGCGGAGFWKLVRSGAGVPSRCSNASM